MTFRNCKNEGLLINYNYNKNRKIDDESQT